jgi:hypothetical protein
MEIKQIYCFGCQKDIEARLTSGAEIYPSRHDLHSLPFWVCDQCASYVGCHHKTKDRTKPLGCIANPEMLKARRFIHAVIDPLWQNHHEKYRARGWIYRWLAAKMDYLNYHTAEIRTIEEARKIYALALTIKTPEDCRNVE